MTYLNCKAAALGFTMQFTDVFLTIIKNISIFDFTSVSILLSICCKMRGFVF